MLREPITSCTYGWGRVLRLYQDHLDINGTFYALNELLQVRPTYRHTLGVSSARIELRFKKKRLVLRGIAAIDAAQTIVEHLTYMLAAQQNSIIDAETVLLLPDLDSSALTEPIVECRSSPSTEKYGSDMVAIPPVIKEQSPAIVRAEADTYEYATPHTPTIPVIVPPPVTRREQRERRLRRLQAERAMREHGFDVETLAQRLKAETLPLIQVPIRLLDDETAHYSTDATLCGEPLHKSKRYKYRAKDQGTLIFTNQRMIYTGRKCQIILSYVRLLHISRLRGAIAFLAEHWSRREIFEVRRPLECTMYLEAILQRFQHIHLRDDMDVIRQGSTAHSAPPPDNGRHRTPLTMMDIETMSLTFGDWEMLESPIEHIMKQAHERIGELEESW